MSTATGKYATATSYAIGGAGGSRIEGSGKTAGASSAVAASAVTTSATYRGDGLAYASATGGAGGHGYDGAAGGASAATASLLNAGPAATDFGGIILHQYATGDQSGDTTGPLGGPAAGAGGAGYSSLTFDDALNPTQADTIKAVLKAYGGRGGVGYSGATGGAGGAGVGVANFHRRFAQRPRPGGGRFLRFRHRRRSQQDRGLGQGQGRRCFHRL